MIVSNGHTIQETSSQSLKADEVAWLDLTPLAVRSNAAMAQRFSGHDDIIREALEPRDRAFYMNRYGIAVLTLFEPIPGGVQPLTMVIGAQFLLTIHDQTSPTVTEVQEMLHNGRATYRSNTHLAYRLCLQVADSFRDAADAYEEAFDQLEDDVLDHQDRSHQVFQMRRELHLLRRQVAEERRIASQLAREEWTEAQSGSPFLDVYEALYHVIDNIDGLRDNLTGLVDLQLNQRSMRMNEVMKLLTIFSTVFLPLSFITGFFGMNFHSMVPELSVGSTPNEWTRHRNARIVNPFHGNG